LCHKQSQALEKRLLWKGYFYITKSKCRLLTWFIKTSVPVPVHDDEFTVNFTFNVKPRISILFISARIKSAFTKSAEIHEDKIPFSSAWSILKALGTKALICINVTVVS